VSLRSVNRVWMRVALVAGFCLTPMSAHAHLVQTGFGTFYDGMVHLVLTPADLLVVLGLGLLAGSCGAAAARGVLLALPGTWLIGGLIGFSSSSVSSLPWATTLSFGLVGLLVAMNAKLPRLWIVSFAGVAGLLHGYIDGATMGANVADWLSLTGVITMVFILVTLLAALVVSLRTYWARMAVRVAGSWIVAIGLLTLGWLVRGNG
jgi:urease accessory protein